MTCGQETQKVCVIDLNSEKKTTWQQIFLIDTIHPEVVPAVLILRPDLRVIRSIRSKSPHYCTESNRRSWKLSKLPMYFATMLKVLLGTHITAHSILHGAKLSTSTTKCSPNTKIIVVIGGGAAGYFSAIECAKLLSESQRNIKNALRYEVALHNLTIWYGFDCSLQQRSWWWVNKFLNLRRSLSWRPARSL